jgi:hypothetical protein
MNQRAFDHVLIIMFENQYRGYVMGNQYMRNLAAQGIELTNSFGVMHPSQTNYISSISGELCGVNDDDVPVPFLPQNTIVDLIEGSPCKLDWRAYMDSYVAGWTPWTAEGFKPIDAFPYVLKHNPFSSYANILNSKQRWQKVENEAGFYRDLLNGDFPEYAWFTPNMWNDGHYLRGSTDNDLKGERAPILVDQQADWLKLFFDGLNFPGPNSKLPRNTLVVVTYDEADFEESFDPADKFKYNYDGPNQIYTTLLGDMIEPGQQNEGYNHYSLLKTVEQNFNLGSLEKNDRDANWFQFLWGRAFKWHTSQTTPMVEVKAIQAATYLNQMFVAYITSAGHLHYRTFDGEKLSPSMHLADHCDQHLSLAANEDGLLLAYRDDEHHLVVMMYDLQGGWHSTEKPVGGHVEHFSFVGDHVEHFSIIAIPNQNAFMLVYEDLQGDILSLRYEDDEQEWQKTPDKLRCKCDGPFELAALGATLLLIYKVPGSDNMACLSYNTAEFNKMDVANSTYAGPYDNATVNTWSPCAFSINHFGSAPSLVTPGEAEPTIEGYQINGNLTCTTLDGVIHLMHNNLDNRQLVTETFSISGTLTPKNPVSYDPAVDKTTSNGYGTMAEAGWSTQSAINGVMRNANSPLAATKYKDELWLFYQPIDQKVIRACCGDYHKVDQ